VLRPTRHRSMFDVARCSFCADCPDGDRPPLCDGDALFPLPISAARGPAQ